MLSGRKWLRDPGLLPWTRLVTVTRTEPVSPDPEAGGTVKRRSLGPACPSPASTAGVRATLGPLFLPPLGHGACIPRFPAIAVGR